MGAQGTQDTRREQLLAAIVHVAGEEGYEGATIARVVGRAGVSRSTFYVHFAGKEDCFLAALGEIDRRVLAGVGSCIERQSPEHAAAAAVGALVAFAEREPTAAKVVTNEALAGGPGVLDARDKALAALARLIEERYRDLDGGAVIPDVRAEILLGAVQRLLASRLGRGERGPLGLEADLLEWLAGYAHPAAAHRWRTLTAFATPARSPFVAEAPLRAPPPLAPGRARRSASAVAENQRLRIVFATAECVQSNGYLAASVAEITRLAGVDGRVFYQLFADKQDALMAVHELGFQRTMSVTAGAFFAAEEWPQRIWEAGRACTQCLEQNPILTRASLIEGRAGGRDTVLRFEDLVAGFTIFLQEGYDYQPREQGVPPSGTALQAIAAASLETLYRQARASSRPAMAELLPQLTYMCLAPFLGAVRAGELIDELIDAGARAQPAGRRRA